MSGGRIDHLRVIIVPSDMVKGERVAGSGMVDE